MKSAAKYTRKTRFRDFKKRVPNVVCMACVRAVLVAFFLPFSRYICFTHSLIIWGGFYFIRKNIEKDGPMFL